MNTLIQNPVPTATIVPESERLEALPRYFGSILAKAETQIFCTMNFLCETYEGAYWDFYELSNGGFYMAPQLEGDLVVEVDANYFNASVSADAAGIIACLFAYSEMTQLARERDRFCDLFHQLRDFACEHEERHLILRAID